ncbi:hypothetical protein AAFF_G00097090 [Aldrovandia affinis]|uniref:Uncharacterized protein n=1 Tax=Aldrovandia affinis TaxID=143900 RepID=A0AAD7RVI6_9TELE|nr:hypothetical protein AAFF_G00097090 [Aldrovandia affinis]
MNSLLLLRPCDRGRVNPAECRGGVRADGGGSLGEAESRQSCLSRHFCKGERDRISTVDINGFVDALRCVQ